MRIVNKALVREFVAQATHCEWCHKKGPVEAHHLWAKGHGGGHRLDVLINLIALCRQDHQAHHDGNEPTRSDLVAVVAAREKMLQDDLVAEITRLRNLPKGGL